MLTTTDGIREEIEGLHGLPLRDKLALAQLYHTARLADAMTRLAAHLENGQIATLREGDIVNVLDRIADGTNRYER